MRGLFRWSHPTEETVPGPSTNLASAQSVTQAPLGLRVLVEGVDPIIDIVAVHGLNGHSEETWTAGNSINWLYHLLPHDLPNARIMTWGYDASTDSRSRVSCLYLYNHAKTLVSDLCLERELTETSRRPVIFIAHSLGGIIVKSALIHSDAARQSALEGHRSIKVSTYGIIFMGTPHQGVGGIAFGGLIVNLASISVAANNQLLKNLEEHSEWLQQQLGQYEPISKEFFTKFAFEEYKTPTVLGHSIMVVPRASAVMPGTSDAETIVIHADHIRMVQFEGRSDPGYKTVSDHVRLMARRAVEVIEGRWDTESMVKAAYSSQAVELVNCVMPIQRNLKFTRRERRLSCL